MAVIFEDPGDEARRAFFEGLQFLLPKDDPLRGPLRNATLRGIRMLTLTLDDLYRQDPLRSKEPSGWRFLTSGDSVAALGDVRRSPRSNAQELVSLSTDEKVVPQVIRSLRTIEARPEFDGHEVTLLRIPGILTEALWLHKPGAADAIVPVLTRSPELTIEQSYTPAEFAQRVLRVAERFRKFEHTENQQSIPPVTQA